MAQRTTIFAFLVAFLITCLQVLTKSIIFVILLVLIIKILIFPFPEANLRSRQKLFESPGADRIAELQLYLNGNLYPNEYQPISRTLKIGNNTGGTVIWVRDIRNTLEPYTNPTTKVRDTIATGAIREGVEEKYLTMICEFVNRSNGRNEAASIPICAVLDFFWYITIYNPHVNEATRWDRGAETLASLCPCKTESNALRFLQIKYIFLVARDPAKRDHHVLISISPQARTVEILDSLTRRNQTQGTQDHYFKNVFGVLAVFLQDAFIPADWRIRYGFSKIQGPTRHCGAYALTSAMCLAFGYPIDYPCDKDHPENIVNRRLRMADELRNGNFGIINDGDGEQPYNYDLYDTQPGRDIADGWEDWWRYQHAISRRRREAAVQIEATALMKQKARNSIRTAAHIQADLIAEGDDIFAKSRARAARTAREREYS